MDERTLYHLSPLARILLFYVQNPSSHHDTTYDLDSKNADHTVQLKLNSKFTGMSSFKNKLFFMEVS